MSYTPRLHVRALQYHELPSSHALQWLWHGYIAPGNMTLLTSQWKAGKTTLIAALLHHMKAGGSLAGQTVRAGNAVVLSEEDPALWHERGTRFDFADHVRWLCRPFCGKPTTRQFHDLLEDLLALHAEAGLSLVVIDTLATFLPSGSENSADAMVAFLASLQRLTTAGIAILILHHPRKKSTREGQAARGSGALSGAVDVLIELGWFTRPSSADRRRRLKAWSRHANTPARLAIELNESGTDYTVVPWPASLTPKDDTLPGPLDEVLRTATYKLTRQEILDSWPSHSRRPSANYLWRCLDRAHRANLILREGTGHKDDPFLFWLPEREQEWLADPLTKLAIENFEKWKQEKRQKKAALVDEGETERE